MLGFASRLAELDLSTDNVNNSLKSLDDIIFKIYSRCCLMKTKTISHNQISKPWINRDIFHYVRKNISYNISVTGIFLLRKFHLGKFHLENFPHMEKNNVAGNSGMPVSANL